MHLLLWQTGLTPVRYLLAACLVIAGASRAHAQDAPDKPAPRDGVYPVVGSIPGGAGLSGGAGFKHPLFGTDLRIDAQANAPRVGELREKVDA